MLDNHKVLDAFSRINDPDLHRSLTDLKMVRNVQVHGGKVEVIIALTVPNCLLKGQLESDMRTQEKIARANKIFIEARFDKFWAVLNRVHGAEEEDHLC